MKTSFWFACLLLINDLAFVSSNLQNTCHFAFKELKKSARTLSLGDLTGDNLLLISELDNFLKTFIKLKERINAASKKSQEFFRDELDSLLTELQPKLHKLTNTEIKMMALEEQLLVGRLDNFSSTMEGRRKELDHCTDFESAVKIENEITQTINSQFQHFDSAQLSKQKAEIVHRHLMGYTKNYVFETRLHDVVEFLSKAINKLEDIILEFQNVVSECMKSIRDKMLSLDPQTNFKIYPQSHYVVKVEELSNTKSYEKIPIEFIDADLDSDCFTKGSEICSDLNSRCLLVNSGSYVHKNSPKAKLPEIEDKQCADAQMIFHFDIPKGHSMGVLTYPSVALALGTNWRYVDRPEAESGWLMVKPSGYVQLKSRIYFQLQIADELKFDTLIVSALYGSGEDYMNHPENIAIAYASAARLFADSSIKKIIFIGEKGHHYSDQLKEILQRMD